MQAILLSVLLARRPTTNRLEVRVSAGKFAFQRDFFKCTPGETRRLSVCLVLTSGCQEGTTAPRHALSLTREINRDSSQLHPMALRRLRTAGGRRAGFPPLLLPFGLHSAPKKEAPRSSAFDSYDTLARRRKPGGDPVQTHPGKLQV